MPPENSNTLRRLRILLHAAFFASGIATVIIGQLLPIMKEKFALGDGQLANFFPAQFAGSLVGTLSTTWFGKRNRFLPASYTGCFLMGAGVLLLNFGSYEMCLFGFFVNGLGIGLTLPAINMLILEMNAERAAAALSVLNFFWGVGAIVSQPFVDLFARGTNIFAPTVILSIVLVALAAALALSREGAVQKPASGEGEQVDFGTPIWSNPLAWLIAGFNFIHVGFESAIGGWLKTYAQRIDGGAAHILPPIFLFYVFFVAGRGVAPIFFRYLTENRVLFLCLLTILLGVLILLAAKGVFLLSAGAAIAGLGTAAVFPTNVSRFTQTFGASASRRATPFFVCGTLGAAFTTWLVGFVSSSFGNDLRSGMFILLGSVSVLLILQVVLSKHRRPN